MPDKASSTTNQKARMALTTPRRRLRRRAAASSSRSRSPLAAEKRFLEIAQPRLLPRRPIPGADERPPTDQDSWVTPEGLPLSCRLGEAAVDPQPLAVLGKPAS